MLSGIGSATALRSFNIPVIADRPGVGQNLWDQPSFGPAYLARAKADYLERQAGPLNNLSGDYFGWEKLPAPCRARLSAAARADLVRFPSDWAELEIVPTAFGPPNATANVAAFVVALVAPLSRGSMALASTDLQAYPSSTRTTSARRRIGAGRAGLPAHPRTSRCDGGDGCGGRAGAHG